MLLKDKLSLVTGAARGLGEAIARRMAAEGAHVLVVDRDLEPAQRVAASIRAAGGRADADSVDVSDAAAVDALAARIAAAHGDIDVLVNNAGISARSKFDEPGAREAWDRVLSVNLQGVFNVTQAFVPALKRTHGSIVNLSSIVAFGAGISSAGYVVAKGGVRSLTQVLARDLAPWGVRVNAVAPGIIDSPMHAPETHGFLSTLQPAGRLGTVDEIADAVLYLVNAGFTSGAVLPVDGAGSAGNYVA